MEPSIDAKEELARLRAIERSKRMWNRVWPWLAILAAFGMHALDRWWIAQQSIYERIEREQELILSQDRAAMMCGLPKVVFVLQGSSVREITDTLQQIETQALMMRMDENQRAYQAGKPKKVGG